MYIKGGEIRQSQDFGEDYTGLGLVPGTLFLITLNAVMVVLFFVIVIKSVCCCFGAKENEDTTTDARTRQDDENEKDSRGENCDNEEDITSPKRKIYHPETEVKQDKVNILETQTDEDNNIKMKCRQKLLKEKPGNKSSESVRSQQILRPNGGDPKAYASTDEEFSSRQGSNENLMDTNYYNKEGMSFHDSRNQDLITQHSGILTADRNAMTASCDDFSDAVPRNSEILKSFRRPPPPRHRAAPSRRSLRRRAQTAQHPLDAVQEHLQPEGGDTGQGRSLNSSNETNTFACESDDNKYRNSQSNHRTVGELSSRFFEQRNSSSSTSNTSITRSESQTNTSVSKTTSKTERKVSEHTQIYSHKQHSHKSEGNKPKPRPHTQADFSAMAEGPSEFSRIFSQVCDKNTSKNSNSEDSSEEYSSLPSPKVDNTSRPKSFHGESRALFNKWESMGQGNSSSPQTGSPQVPSQRNNHGQLQSNVQNSPVENQPRGAAVPWAHRSKLSDRNSKTKITGSSPTSLVTKQFGNENWHKNSGTGQTSASSSPWVSKPRENSQDTPMQGFSVSQTQQKVPLGITRYDNGSHAHPKLMVPKMTMKPRSEADHQYYNPSNNTLNWTTKYRTPSPENPSRQIEFLFDQEPTVI